MRLWVIAQETGWQEVLCHKHLHNDRGRRPEYAWLCDQMRRRVPGYSGLSIWWAWYQVDGHGDKAPDARQCDALHHSPPGTRMVCLEAHVPTAEILLSEHTLWQRVCSHPDYLAYDAQEYAACMASRSAGRTTAEIAQMIHSSWERAFTPSTWGQFDTAWIETTQTLGRNIQATFETLRGEHVVDVLPFTSQQPALRLPPVELALVKRATGSLTGSLKGRSFFDLE